MGTNQMSFASALDPALCMSLMLFASEPSMQGKTWIFNVKKKQEPEKNPFRIRKNYWKTSFMSSMHYKKGRK